MWAQSTITSVFEPSECDAKREWIAVNKPVALNSVTCDLVGETKLLSLLEAFLAYLLNLWQFNIVPMC